MRTDGKILGAVLAGGQGRRFGGDKALALLDGKPLIDWAIESLSEHVVEVVICGRALEGRTCLADRPRPSLGPLGGLNAALHHGRALGCVAVLTSGCDTPFLPHSSARALIGEGVAVIAGHHLVGFWPCALADALDAHLRDDGDRSIRGWIARTGEKAVSSALPLPTSIP